MDVANAPTPPLPTLGRNLAANFLGRGWSALVSLAVVPLYIHFMGIEAYGLVGIFVSLAALASLLDFGLGTVIIREFAALSTRPASGSAMRDLLCTLERLYWLMALIIGLTVAISAGLIAEHWIRADSLGSDTVRQTITLIGIAISAQWPLALYSGGLAGLQAQVLLNSVNAAVTTFRAIGAVLILWIWSPTVEAFFLWQACVSAIHTLLVAFLLRRRTPGIGGRFQFPMVRQLLPFALAMFGIAASSVVLTQIDKVILSRLLSLEAFGYYTLGATVAATLFHLVWPIYSAVFPRFTQLSTAGAQEDLAATYHASCKLMSFLLLPVAAIIAAFSHDLLLLWTRDPALAENSALVLSLLICGNALNGMLTMPYALQLAGGSVGPVLRLNIAAAILMVPLALILVERFGAPGGSLAWLLINIGYIAIAVPLIHGKRLPGATRVWYLRDVLPPLIAVSVTACAARWAMPGNLGDTAAVLWISGSLLVAGMAGLLTLPGMSSKLLGRLR